MEEILSPADRYLVDTSQAERDFFVSKTGTQKAKAKGLAMAKVRTSSSLVIVGLFFPTCLSSNNS